MSARRLSLLVKHLPLESATLRELSDGEPPFSRLEGLIADVWALWAKKDHPKRLAIESKAKQRAKNARVIELRTKFEKRKRTYGLE